MTAFDTASPNTFAVGASSGDTTVTATPRLRSDAAVSSPMKLDPNTTTCSAEPMRASTARQSARLRSTRTWSASAPGRSGRLGSAPVASSSLA